MDKHTAWLETVLNAGPALALRTPEDDLSPDESPWDDGPHGELQGQVDWLERSPEGEEPWDDDDPDCTCIYCIPGA